MPISESLITQLKTLPADSFIRVEGSVLPTHEDVAWLVITGSITVRLREEPSTTDSIPVELATLNGGAVIPQLPKIQSLAALNFIIEPGSNIIGIKTPKLLEFLKANQQPELLEELYCEFVSALSEKLHSFFRADIKVNDSEINEQQAGDILLSNNFYTYRLESGAADYFASGLADRATSDIFFITPYSWIYTPVNSRLVRIALPEHQELAAGLHNFLQQLLDIAGDLYFTQEGFSRRLQLMREYKNADDANKIKTELASILSKDDLAFKGKVNFPLQTAMEIIGKRIKVNFIKPTVQKNSLHRNPIIEWALASNVQYRKVQLDDGWWHEDGGVMLGFQRQRNSSDEIDIVNSSLPLVLLPRTNGNYIAINPAEGRKFTVNAKEAENIHPLGYYFFNAFPQREVGVGDLVRWIIRGQGYILLTIFACSILTGLIGVIPPIAMSYLFNEILPFSMESELVQFTILLVVISLTMLTFNVIQSFCSQRLEGMADLSLEAAIWDRIIRQVPSFFRKFSTGDLVNRANGINTLRSIITGSTLKSLFGIFMSIPSLIYLFVLNLKLAIVAIVLIVLFVLVRLIFGYIAYTYQRNVPQYNGLLQDYVLQLIISIEKIRSTFSAASLLKGWAKLFTSQSKYAYSASFFNQIASTASTVLPQIATFFIYGLGIHWMNAKTDAEPMSTGSFVSFLSAFSIVNSSISSTATALLHLLNAQPYWKRLQPILTSIPPDWREGTSIGHIQGRIDVSHVSFRYPGSDRLILDDVSFTVEPGEFVALVGKSGTGKSTLLRLMLAFEEVQTGAILYDNYDISEVDIGQLRRQFGVVLQRDGLMLADIFTNISSGNSNCTLNKAWAAAEMAGIANDIRAMPMQMHTLVSDGGSTISGGQAQRIMLARALANDPHILFLDEATNALDNKVQDTVSRNLDNLGITRVVIAHRLSTIVNADKILVLDQGKIVQSGTYSELASRPGLFKELIERQEVNT